MRRRRRHPERQLPLPLPLFTLPPIAGADGSSCCCAFSFRAVAGHNGMLSSSPIGDERL